MGRKKLKGSAMLWAVFSLLIVVFVLTGILALNKSYEEEEVAVAASRRAEYFARSAVELTADMIIKGELPVPDTKNVLDQYEQISISYPEIAAEVIIDKPEKNWVRISAKGRSGNSERTLTGIMNYSKNKWGFAGYAAD